MTKRSKIRRIVVLIAMWITAAGALLVGLPRANAQVHVI
jgi:hypothetical protein